ncbi:MAG: hypothetical protein H0U45_11725 [Tatlockia sp.]|jgi:Arc/MetJ-type ribon-helix-helix transcriptional regulator|nr:hypothetical protein [Tatlockia sp.]
MQTREGEYIRDLIRADHKRRAEAQLETLLLERLRTNTATEFDVDQVKAKFAKRITQRGKKNK